MAVSCRGTQHTQHTQYTQYTQHPPHTHTHRTHPSYVQDADLWAWKLPGSREFHAGLSQLGLEYSALANPGIFEQLLRIDVDDIIRRVGGGFIGIGWSGGRFNGRFSLVRRDGWGGRAKCPAPNDPTIRLPTCSLAITVRNHDPPHIAIQPAQGAGVLAEQQRQIAAAVESASTLRLGGELGSQRAWGQALGCVVSGALVGWRSALGNALAERSAQMGLEPVGVVAYVEVGQDG